MSRKTFSLRLVNICCYIFCYEYLNLPFKTYLYSPAAYIKANKEILIEISFFLFKKICI